LDVEAFAGVSQHEGFVGGVGEEVGAGYVAGEFVEMEGGGGGPLEDFEVDLVGGGGGAPVPVGKNVDKTWFLAW
jgi:hypothetical protein